MKRITEEQWEGLFRRFEKGGCPVRRDHGYRLPPFGLVIEKPPESIVNQMYELEAGGACYVLEFALRNELDRPIDVVGFQIETPWGIPKLSVLPAPKKNSFSYPNYILPDRSRYFEPECLLNPVFARKKTRLYPGQEVEGLLVTLGEGPIPEDVQDRTRIPVTLSIFDSRRNQYSSKFKMFVDRTGRRIRERLAREREEARVREAEYWRKCKEKENQKRVQVPDAPVERISYEDPRYWEESHRKYLEGMAHYRLLLEEAKLSLQNSSDGDEWRSKLERLM